MKTHHLTDMEFILLGLVAEMPRHGYALEEILSQRGVREWADIGTSSLYFVLSKLEKRGLVASLQEGGSKSRKTYSATPEGRSMLETQVLQALAEPVTAFSNLLPALANWPAADAEAAREALCHRRERLETRIVEVAARREEQQPLPDFVEAMFDYSLGQMRAEARWLAGFLTSQEAETMQKTDFKKELKPLYSPAKKDWVEVEVPPLTYLMVDGQGSPGEAPEYAHAVQWLFSVSYPLKFLSKKELQRDYAVMPLEGLWWADDMEAFIDGKREEWRWTMMILQPEWITIELLDRAISKAVQKLGEPPASLRLETLEEGRCLQILHVGSYADEAPVLHRLHHDVMPARGQTFNGKHHEIYLSDPQRVPPEKLKTILRQPVRGG
ncbi:MAG: GyrI-like domain-containing protein [Nitratireductor sp.]|nr:GyrI-like domain-containing protein [Nitratireductor sp.]